MSESRQPLPISSLPVAGSARVLAAPAGLSARAICASAVRLTWGAPAPAAAGFRIERREGDGVWVHVGTIPPECTSFESTGTLAGRTYAHRVCVMSEDMGDWAESGPVTMPASHGQSVGRRIVAATEEFPRNGEGSLVLLNDGRLVYYYAAYRGHTEDFSHGTLRAIVSADMGKTWGPSQHVLAHETDRYTRLSVARMPDGRLLLTYGLHRPVGRSARAQEEHLPTVGDELRVAYRMSADEGKTWSDEQMLSDDSRWRCAHSRWDGIWVLSNGRILVPAQVSQSHDSTYGTYIKYSDDSGKTWSRSPRTGCMVVLENPYGNSERGFWEIGIVEHAPGKLLAHGRTVTGWLYECRSEDYATTWTAPRRVDIPQPKAPPCLTKIPGTRMIVRVWNPYLETGKVHWHMGKRIILASQISEDDGRTWHGYREIEYGNGRDWYCYPSFLWVGEQLHIAYFCWPEGEERGWSELGLEVRYRTLSKAWLLGRE